jgi:FimV-like protein
MLEGDINAARKDWPAAVAAYKAALRVDPAASELAVKLHAATQASGATREAEQFAATWLGAHPKDVAFLWHLASGAIARNDYAGAEKLYQSLLQVQPSAALALNNLAWAQLQLGKDGALGHAEKANTLAPNQPQFMDTLAMVLSARGEHAKAVELQAKALALQPKSDALRLNLARIYIAAGDKTKARAELETISKAGDTSPYPAEASALLKTL